MAESTIKITKKRRYTKIAAFICLSFIATIITMPAAYLCAFIVAFYRGFYRDAVRQFSLDELSRN